MTAERQGPLSRFKVIDLTRARAGPTAARHFADFGADVIKVEMPATGEEDMLGGGRDAPDFFNLHRNKRSISLNLKSRGRRRHPEEAGGDGRRADRELPPRRQAPARHRLRDAAQDQPAARLRLASRASARTGPTPTARASTRSRRAWAGSCPSPACRGRGRCGSAFPSPTCRPATTRPWAPSSRCWSARSRARASGCRPRCCRRRSPCSTSRPRAGRWRGRCRARPATTTRPRSRPACSRPPTGTSTSRPRGSTSSSACARRWTRPASVADPEFDTADKRSENRVRLNAELAARTKTYRSQELVERLNAAGVPSGPIYSIDQVFADPQVKHVGMAVPMPHPRRSDVAVVNQAVSLSRTPPVIDRPTPERRPAHRGDPGGARLRQRRHRRPAPAQGDLRWRLPLPLAGRGSG